MSMNVANSSTYLNPRGYSTTSQEPLMPPDDPRVKKFKILSAVLGVTTLAFIIALAVVAANKKSPEATTTTPAGTHSTTPTTAPKVNVCMRSECRDAAAHFLTIMDTEADPCQDFYSYVCGKWANETEIPKEKSRYGVFDDLRDGLAKTCIEALESPEPPEKPTTAVNNSRALYQACVSTENVDKDSGVQQLRQILNDVGVSDIITDNDTRVFNLYDTLATITKTYGLNFIINFAVTPDDNNTVNNIITLDQPEDFGLGRNFLLGNDSDPRVTAYKKYMTEALCLFSDSQQDCSHLDSMVDSIFDFEVNVAKFTRDLVDRRSAKTWYFVMPFTELKEKVPKIDFLDYSKKILGETGKNLTDRTTVMVKEETYFRNVSEYLESATLSTKSNYLAWRLVQYFGPYLFREFRSIKFRFDQVNEGITQQQDIKIVCFDKTNEYFGHAVGRLYVDKAFDEASKQDVENMVKNLANAFRKLLDQNTWMDADTKKEAGIKLEKMISFIGFPEWSKNDTRLNDYYKGVIMNAKNMSGSLTSIMDFTAKKTFSKLWLTNNRKTEWVTQASIVNAFYNPSANSITFPAGILQVPFYGKRPRYLNYGAIGYVIGHEITHGYDDQGSEFDGDGNLINWWSNETLEEFNTRKECFINQYTRIVDKQTGRHLNGSQTIGENIADNGGIREAYQAYLLSGEDNERLPGFEDFSDLKMFFMSAASVWCTKFRDEGMINSINNDVHAPGMYRAYIPLANTEEFAQVFNCPKNSTMNPSNRCVIW